MIMPLSLRRRWIAAVFIFMFSWTPSDGLKRFTSPCIKGKKVVMNEAVDMERLKQLLSPRVAWRPHFQLDNRALQLNSGRRRNRNNLNLPTLPGKPFTPTVDRCAKGPKNFFELDRDISESLHMINVVWPVNCIGVFIAPSWIMMSAHCVAGLFRSRLRVELGVGSAHVMVFAEEYKTRNKAYPIKHQRYRVGGLAYDIALLSLMLPNVNRLPACAPYIYINIPAVGDTCAVVFNQVKAKVKAKVNFNVKAASPPGQTNTNINYSRHLSYVNGTVIRYDESFLHVKLIVKSSNSNSRNRKIPGVLGSESESISISMSKIEGVLMCPCGGELVVVGMVTHALPSLVVDNVGSRTGGTTGQAAEAAEEGTDLSVTLTFTRVSRHLRWIKASLRAAKSSVRLTELLVSDTFRKRLH